MKRLFIAPLLILMAVAAPAHAGWMDWMGGSKPLAKWTPQMEAKYFQVCARDIRAIPAEEYNWMSDVRTPEQFVRKRLHEPAPDGLLTFSRETLETGQANEKSGKYPHLKSASLRWWSCFERFRLAQPVT